jgi:thiol-disulfide isomerase/thioredoxin
MRALAFAVLLAISQPASAEDIRAFVRGSWSELRQAHAGKPIIVHFWGMTCGPCIAELPHWAALQRERPDMNLVLIAADPIREEPQDLVRFLGRAGLSPKESWAFADDFIDRLYFEVDPRWRGELPRTLLIKADGSSTLIRGVSDPDAVRAWLDAQKAGAG